jgi:opacity protein-like surface antigen
LNEKQLAIMPIVMYRFNGLGTITPFAGIGPRVTMLRSTVRGSSGSQDLGETTEQSTAFGVGIPVGAEFELGPGALLAELMFEYGGLDHRATGDASTAGTSLMVGYRFLL